MTNLSKIAASLIVVGAANLHAQAKPAPKLDDPTIVAIFDAANTWDIETGGLAVKKGSTQDVRDFGKMLAAKRVFVRVK